MKILPVAVYRWANLAATIFIPRDYTIAHLFAYCIFWCQAGHECTWKYLWEGKIKRVCVQDRHSMVLIHLLCLLPVLRVWRAQMELWKVLIHLRSILLRALPVWLVRAFSHLIETPLRRFEKKFANRLKFEECCCNWLAGWLKAKSNWKKFVVTVELEEWELFGVNSLIVLSVFVISEYLQFRGANSLHNLSLDFEFFTAHFISAAKLFTGRKISINFRFQ